MKLATFGKDRTLSVDSAEGLFCRSGQTIALFSIKPATVRLRPISPNPDRITLYRQSGRYGLSAFYYRTDTNRYILAYGDNIISIQRDDIPAIRKSMRKFTRTSKWVPPKKKADPYPPPPEK